MAKKGGDGWHSELPRDPKLRSWYDNVANGSKITADVYLRRLRAFCAQMNLDRYSLVDKKRKETDLRDLLVRFVNEESAKGRSGEYIRSTIKAVRSWLLHHGRKFDLPVKIPGMGSRPSLENEELPTQEQLRSVFIGATPNERLCCALMAFSGLRPEAIGNYEGTDGLRVSDLVGVEVDGSTLRFPNGPLRVRVRAAHSKAGHSYFTFLGEEGTRYLREVLEGRIRQGERIEPDSDVIHPYRAHKRFVRALNVGDQVRLALRRGGLKIRPYALRSYFASRLLEAQNAGKVARDYSEFWMGHTGDVTQRHYTTGRARLADSLVRSMADAYKRCEPFLSTAPVADSNDGATRVLRALLIERGLPKEQAEKLDMGAMSDAEIQALFKKLGAAATPPSVQRAVNVIEVPKLLEDGWEFVSRLDGENAVLRSPAGWIRPAGT